jgi:uncharacterized protein with PIN domain
VSASQTALTAAPGPALARIVNFGDCFAYSLARATGEPLLFKGDDFGHTDIEAALPVGDYPAAGTADP